MGELGSSAVAGNPGIGDFVQDYNKSNSRLSRKFEQHTLSEWVMAWSGCKAMDDKEERKRSSLSEQLSRRESSDLVRRESWQSECSWGDEGSTCLGLAIDGPWSSNNPAFDSQSEISTEVRE